MPLGRRSYGQAASRAYFDKDVGDLELHEAAYLSILPKAPEVYSREKNFGRALERRNWVLDSDVSIMVLSLLPGRHKPRRARWGS
ncbi:MAG: transglycosylase domain-containing protein [Sphingomonadaceae bacterium]